MGLTMVYWDYGIGYWELGIGTFWGILVQGGGGRFKNRKPIGELGCCESRMAERSH